MKNLRLISITIVSHREGKARKVIFHPKKNLLVGRNHTGKSSIIKTIFKTLGASPSGKLVQWDESCISLVTLMLNDETYHFLHKDSCRSIFDKNFELLFSSNKSEEWRDFFASWMGFNLALTSRNGGAALANPACFFLPFYVDQDSGWGSDWKTFKAVYSYKSPNKAILEYFTGIKPSEYYKKQTEKKALAEKLEDSRAELKFLIKVKEKIGDNIRLDGVKLSFDNFEKEVRDLIVEIGVLEKKQVDIKQEIIKYEKSIASLKVQIDLSQESLKSFKKDYDYLKKIDDLECPTCGAVHENSFLDNFKYVEDSRVLSDILFQLNSDLSARSKTKRILQNKLHEVKEKHKGISSILAERKDGIALKDVIESSGAEQAVAIFYKESSEIQVTIDQFILDISKLDERLKELTDPKKSKVIMSDFREKYRSARHKLNLPTIDPAKIKRTSLVSKPDLSGSGGPRSTLAFYSAIWNACYGEYAEYSIPIVIDSPNQKGQDQFNLPKVLSFISNDLPSDAQIIISSEVESEEDFDMVTVFDKPYSILNADYYDELSQSVDPLVTDMMTDLFS